MPSDSADGQDGTGRDILDHHLHAVIFVGENTDVQYRLGATMSNQSDSYAFCLQGEMKFVVLIIVKIVMQILGAMCLPS